MDTRDGHRASITMTMKRRKTRRRKIRRIVKGRRTVLATLIITEYLDIFLSETNWGFLSFVYELRSKLELCTQSEQMNEIQKTSVRERKEEKNLKMSSLFIPYSTTH